MSRKTLRRRSVWLLAFLALPGWVVTQPSGAEATSGAQWPAVTESSGCGQLRTYPPLATRTGRLPRSEIVGGPYGALFGRTIGEVEDSQVWWTVPMSGGQRIRVHQLALPAFQLVTANLAAAAAEGKWYPISVVRGQSSRTIAGRYSMSYHAFGAAVDINPINNPYRSDNTFITDMPGWFVQAWRDAGFCWGGDWLDKKDTMHFSWKGPLPTPGYPSLPDPYPARSQPASFTEPVAMPSPPFGPLDGSHRYLIGNVSGRGAPDVVQLEQHDLGVIVNIARASVDYAGCAVQRGFAFDVDLADRTVLLGDFSATARSDLWEIDASGAPVAVTIHSADSGFFESQKLITGITSQPGDLYLAGDVDDDGRDDLYVLRRGAVTRLEVWAAVSGFGTQAVNVELPVDTESGRWRFALGDRDVDGEPDIYAIDLSGPNAILSIFRHADGYAAAAENTATAASVGAGGLLEVVDHDGDGRDDLIALNPDGSLRAFLGNRPLTGDPVRWYRDPNWECDEDAEPFAYVGTFRDDDGTVVQQDIEWMAASGFTKGCDWPYGDHFCPERPVTRAEMATFLARALGLEPIPKPGFIDIRNTTHEPNINAIAAASIAVGCAADGPLYCPDQPVTRAEMATFLVRALRLEPIPGQRFLDVENTTHAPDINAIAAAGITLGCAADGSLYCPDEPVSRGQMAAFLHRALGTP